MPKTKRTWQPKKIKRIKKHGFMERMSSPGGKNVIKRRKAKGRKRVSVTGRSKVESKR
jgi:large subunit ribosomal protein L34